MYSIKLLTNISSLWSEDVALKNEAQQIGLNNYYLKDSSRDGDNNESDFFPYIICETRAENVCIDNPINNNDSTIETNTENISANTEITDMNLITNPSLLYLHNLSNQETNVTSKIKALIIEGKDCTVRRREESRQCLENIYGYLIGQVWRDVTKENFRKQHSKTAVLTECSRGRSYSDRSSENRSSLQNSDNYSNSRKKPMNFEKNENSCCGKQSTNKKQSNNISCCQREESSSSNCACNAGSCGISSEAPICGSCCYANTPEYDEDDDDNDWGGCNRNTCKKVTVFVKGTNRGKEEGPSKKNETRFSKSEQRHDQEIRRIEQNNGSIKDNEDTISNKNKNKSTQSKVKKNSSTVGTDLEVENPDFLDTDKTIRGEKHSAHERHSLASQSGRNEISIANTDLDKEEFSNISETDTVVNTKKQRISGRYKKNKSIISETDEEPIIDAVHVGQTEKGRRRNNKRM